MRQIIPAAFVAVLATLSAWAQPAATQPAGAAPDAAATTQPARIDEEFEARVIKVIGRCSYRRAGDESQAGEWRNAEPGDRLPAGTMVRTRLRSKLVLAFGDDSAVIVEPLTLASVDQFHRSGDTKVIQLGLGHGAVRAGVAETTLRSDMTIETPTATLSKKGTMDFGIEYTPNTVDGTGRFRVYLAREGLVELLDKMSQQSRAVRPGQYVTQAMRRWIETAAQDRWIPVVDVYGLTQTEQAFHMLRDSGLGVIDASGGWPILTFHGRDIGALQAALNSQRTQAGIPSVPVSLGTAIDRPEGNFGTGIGSMSILFKTGRTKVPLARHK